jgi:diguanylate cyclase (GGDEF)-like protein
VAFAQPETSVDDFTRYVGRTLATQAGLGFERVNTAEMLREESLSDPLTAVGNRRRALAALEILKDGDAVALIDLDYFKKVNDTFGHAAGDKILRTVADFLRASVRTPDSVFRYGGEEFLIILSGVGGGGLLILERIHALWQGQKRPATFSAGIAVHRDDDHFEATVARADGALYEAKRSGRDRVLPDSKLS